MTRFVEVPTSALYDPYTPFQYQWSSINFFLAIWLLSGLFRQTLLNTKKLNINKSFYSLDEEKKRNVITYIMEVLLTTLAFILQICGRLDIHAIWLLSDLFRQALLNTKKLNINKSFYSLDE
jgi:uncharacterized membrane protein YqaE (UPF0057 family)